MPCLNTGLFGDGPVVMSLLIQKFGCFFPRLNPSRDAVGFNFVAVCPGNSWWAGFLSPGRSHRGNADGQHRGPAALWGSSDHYLFEKSVSAVIREPVDAALGSDGE